MVINNLMQRRQIFTLNIFILLLFQTANATNQETSLSIQPVSDSVVEAVFGVNAVAIIDYQTGSATSILVDKPALSNSSSFRDYPALAEAWITNYPEVYRVDPADIKLEVNQRMGKINYLIYRQTYHSIPVYQSRIDFRFRSFEKLIMTGATVFPAISLDPNPSVDAQTALQTAQFITEFYSDNNDRVVEAPELFIYVMQDENLQYRLAWRMGLFVHHDDPTRFERSVSNYEIWMDAHNGDLLSLFDRVEESTISGRVTGMVKDLPYGTPTLRPLRNLSVQVAGVGEVLTDGNGYYVIEAGNTTRQVTVEFAGSFIDIDARNVTDARIITMVTPGDTFNVHFNDLNSIAGERDTYYHGNCVHDWMLYLDNNFPGANYSMPAVVNIGSEDNLWPCNAYWDGFGINMFSAGGGCSATDQMADVIFHEYQHGLTQFAYSPFSSPYASGMGEGFSDYTAMTILNTSCMGDGFFGTPGNCLRNGENMRQWPAPECNGQVHCLGEISMGALWKMRQNFIVSFGDTTLAVAHSDTLFRWAMFGRPYTVPELLTEILIVDDNDGTLLNGTPNFVEITDAFDQHNVSSPIPEFGIAHTPVPNTMDTQNNVTIEAVISSIYGDIITAEMIYIINDVANVVTMTDLGSGNFTAQIPPQPTGSIVRYYIHALDEVATELYAPDSAPDRTYFYLVGSLFDFQNIFEDQVEISNDWVLGVTSDDATTGIWEQVDPIGTFTNGLPVQPEDDHSPVGIKCFVTGNASFNGSNAGDNDVDGGRTTLISPPIDLTINLDPVLTYWRWYTNNTGDTPGADTWLVQISADGVTWTDLENTMESAAQWTYHQFLINQYVGQTSQIWIRFIAEDAGGGSLVEAALDDIKLVDGNSFDYLYGDLNFDQSFDVFDIVILVDIILHRFEPSAIQRHVADVNRDGTINVLDVLILVSIIINSNNVY